MSNPDSRAIEFDEEIYEQDFAVTDEGTIWTIRPLTPFGSEWLDENVHTEDWQWFGGELYIDHRFARAILRGISETGLTY